MPTPLSTDERATLQALCDALLPALEPEGNDDPTLFATQASKRGVPLRFENTIAHLGESDQSRFRLFLKMLDQPLFIALQTGRAERFSSLSSRDAERVLLSLSTSRIPDLRAAFQAARRLATFHYYAAITGESPDPIWTALGYSPSPNPPAAKSPLTLTRIDSDTQLECDACVVGSGAGGSVVAAALAAAGMDVIVIEAGSDWQSEDFDQREEPGTNHLYLDSGTTATRDLALALLAGAALGGGTTVNWQTSLRTPDDVRAEWAESSGCSHFADQSFTDALDSVWSRLSIGTDESEANANNATLRDGCIALGYDWSATPRNSRGCDLKQCGYCVYGCRHGGKQSAAVTYLADAQSTGRTRIIARCRANRITVGNSRARGVIASVTGKDGQVHALEIRAKIVVAACGSLHTPALLMRSGLKHPQLGRNLFLHPTTAVGALFDHVIEPWIGAPQTVVCNEFAGLAGGYGFRVETAPAHPGLIALAMPWLGARPHRREMQTANRKAMLIALVRDRSTGSVTIDKAGRPVVDYRPGDAEADMLRQGMSQAARILQAAGAKGVQTLHTHPFGIGEGNCISHRFDDIDSLCKAISTSRVTDNHLAVFSAHQMGTCRMGRDAKTAVCDERGEVFGVSGLYIADASAFPGSSGVNPMVTIMAMAHHTARRIVAG